MPRRGEEVNRGLHGSAEGEELLYETDDKHNKNRTEYIIIILDDDAA